MSKIKALYILTLVFFFTTSLNLSSQVIKDDFRVNDDTVGGSFTNPDVEILENGEEMVAWEDGRDGISKIYGQAYDNTGDSTGRNIKISTIGSGNEYAPAIASFGDSVLVIFRNRYGQWLLSDGSLSGTSFSLGSGSYYRPDVAVSDTGFFVVWDRNLDIFLQRFDFNGDSVGPKIILNDDGVGAIQGDPRIAMNNDGSFVVVWEDMRNLNGDIYGQLVDPSGDTISGNFLINDDGADYEQYTPSCAMDFEGNFVVVWRDNRDTYSRIYGQRFDNTGNPIDTNFLITDESGSFYPYEPSCAMDSAGNFVVVWEDRRSGSDYSVYGQMFDYNGAAVDSNFRMDQSLVSEDDERARVSMNEDNFVVTWQRTGSDRGGIYKRRFLNDGTPVGNEVKVNDTKGTNDQELPAIDMNSSGNVVVTWYDERDPGGVYFQRLDDNGNILGDNVRIGWGSSPDVAVSEDSSFIIVYNYLNNIYLQRFNPSGDSLGTASIISDATNNSREDVSIDINSNNNAVVVWRDARMGNGDIYAQMVDSAGDTTGNNFRVNDDPGTDNQYYPNVTMSPSGSFLVAWQDSRSGSYDIYGQIFDSEGNPVGSNFQIDSGGAPNQFRPVGGYLSDGEFVVVWQDYRTPRGIYGQLIDSTGTLTSSNFKVSEGPVDAYNPSLSVAPSGAAVITWEHYSDIYAQKYNADRTFDSTNFKVNNETEGPNDNQTLPCVATNGNRIFFAWADPKWQKGLDIAAKVFDWDQAGIEDIGEGKEGLNILEISSPILTSKEWLTLSVDSPSRVDFRIINVAGIVVSSKRFDCDTPGIKRVDFDVSKLPCGPYFLYFKTEKSRAIKKTVVIK